MPSLAPISRIWSFLAARAISMSVFISRAIFFASPSGRPLGADSWGRALLFRMRHIQKPHCVASREALAFFGNDDCFSCDTPVGEPNRCRGSLQARGVTRAAFLLRP